MTLHDKHHKHCETFRGPDFESLSNTSLLVIYIFVLIKTDSEYETRMDTEPHHALSSVVAVS